MSKEHHARIYTKKGDSGQSQLFNMTTMNKNADYFEALGDVDELNAWIGVCVESLSKSNTAHRNLSSQLQEIQSRLLDLGAHVATPLRSSSTVQKTRTQFPLYFTTELENWIDKIDANLQPLKTFILPGGGLASAHIHVARCVCRRAERKIVPLAERLDVDHSVLTYINRLSDFLFVAARLVSENEIPYAPCTRKSTSSSTHAQSPLKRNRVSNFYSYLLVCILIVIVACALMFGKHLR
eukprot:TRINITY_DN7541_c0_g1_i1.p1 TRINITY_DN7541_c0_g1~~TRINITY_DN7541_c0_g1_i1.p1  ORF type:complete len:239 (+),score=19.47 TRINITY_DN7541_c0_g1_i1:53-769(+)